MYPSNLDTQGAYIVHEQHLQELRQEMDCWRLAQEVSRDPASGSIPGRMGQFAMHFQNAAGTLLTSHLIQSLSNGFR